MNEFLVSKLNRDKFDTINSLPDNEKPLSEKQGEKDLLKVGMLFLTAAANTIPVPSNYWESTPTLNNPDNRLVQANNSSSDSFHERAASMLQNRYQTLSTHNGNVVSVKHNAFGKPTEVEIMLEVSGKDKILKFFPEDLGFKPCVGQPVRGEVRRKGTVKKLYIQKVCSKSFSKEDLELAAFI